MKNLSDQATNESSPVYWFGRTRWLVGIALTYAIGPVSLLGVLVLESGLQSLLTSVGIDSDLKRELYFSPFIFVGLHVLLYIPIIFLTYFRNHFSWIVTILILVGYFLGLYSALTFEFV